MNSYDEFGNVVNNELSEEDMRAIDTWIEAAYAKESAEPKRDDEAFEAWLDSINELNRKEAEARRGPSLSWEKELERNEWRAAQPKRVPTLKKEIVHVLIAVQMHGFRCVTRSYLRGQFRTRIKAPIASRFWAACESRIIVSLIAGAFFLPLAFIMPRQAAAYDDQHSYRQYADSDHENRRSNQHIAYSDDTFTITLHGCEENTKKHWSCSYTTPDGDTHWMYIPNYKPKHQTAEKGGH